MHHRWGAHAPPHLHPSTSAPDHPAADPDSTRPACGPDERHLVFQHAPPTAVGRSDVFGEALHLDVAGETRTVPLVRWPAESARRDALARAGAPRLLLLDPSTAPPVAYDDDEDWVRLPADHDDVVLRAHRLARIAGPADALDPATAVAARPILDSDGLLRVGDDWVAIPRIESRVLTALLHRMGEVVSRRDLEAAAWPHGAPNERSLDSRVKLLRRRIRDLGLAIHTVRGVGLLLHRVDEPATT